MVFRFPPEILHYACFPSCRTTLDRKPLSQDIFRANQRRLLKLYSDFIRVSLSVWQYWPQSSNDSWDNSNLDVPHSGNLKPVVSVFFKLYNFSGLGIMIIRDRHNDEEIFSCVFFWFVLCFVNNDDVWFAEFKYAVCLNVEISSKILTWSFSTTFSGLWRYHFCSSLNSYFLRNHKCRGKATLSWWRLYTFFYKR